MSTAAAGDASRPPRTAAWSRNGGLEKGERLGMANQLGKMYVCTKCGAQVIVTKAGAGEIKCCGSAMEQKK